MKTSIRNWLVGLTTISLATTTAFAANFTKGNIAVLRMGDGAAALTANATPLFVVEMTTNGIPVQTNAIDATGAGLTASATSTSEAFMTVSPDSRNLVLVGYNVASGTPTIGTAAQATAKRSIATLDQSGLLTIRYTPAATTASNIRSGTTDGAGNFWATIANNQFTYMNTPVVISADNSRVCHVFNGNLYYTVAASLKAYTGAPTTAATATAIVVPTGTTSCYDFAVSSDGNTIYLADDSTYNPGTANGGVTKYTFNGTSWTKAYQLKPNSSSTTGARGVTVDWSGPSPVLYITCAEATQQNNVSRLVDSGSGLDTGTVIATAPANTLYRGIALAPYGAPVITSQPAGQTVTAGNNATYSVTLDAGTSLTGLTYVWKDSLNNTLATHTPGTLTDTFTFSNAQLSDSGKTISVQINNSLGNVTSANADLIVNPGGQPPVINFPVFADQDPIYAGQTVTFEVDVTGTTPMTYSWSLNGSPLSNGGNVSIVDNGLSSKVTFTGITAGQAGTIYCGITNGFGGTSSSLAYTVTVPAAPSITGMNPTGGLTNSAGATQHITVGASDSSGVLTYQWKKGNSNLSNGSQLNGATVFGATTPNLTLGAVLGGDAGTYHCVVSNAGGATDSSPTYEFYMSVTDPIVTTQPTSRLVVEGGTINLSVGATGTGMTFQWSKDGNPLSDSGRISGATTSALAISSAVAGDSGVYTVAVSGTYGSPATTAAKVVVATTTAQPIAATNLVVLQRGDGAETLANTGNTVFILQYTPSGSLVSAYQVPNSGANALLQVGNTPTEGWLTKSADGSQLVFAGYNANIGTTTNLVTATGTAINRSVGTINASGVYTLAAKGTNHSTSNIRSATADGLGNYYTAGSRDGIEMLGTAATTAGFPNGMQIWSKIGNNRVINNFNGNLYLGTSTVIKNDGNDPSSGADGVYAFSGFPTTFQTSPNTNGWYIAIPTNQVDVGIYDFAINPADNIAYITDDQGFSAPDIGGIHRWDKVGGVWTYSYRIGQSTRGLTVDWTGISPVIYATTPVGGSTNGNNFANANNDIIKVVDTGANSAITTIASAVGGSAAGIRLAPGVSQTITFPTIADAYSCSTPIALGATASSGLSVTYSIDAGPATISGGNVVITTPIASPVSVTVRARQSGDATYSPAMDVTRSFTVNPSTFGAVSTPGDANICQGGSFTEAGGSATDSCGNVVAATVTGGPVDVNTLGAYTLTYSVSDATSGATASATRVVTVLDCGINIVTQPQDQLRQPQGTNVTLSVVATSGQPLSYQWFENGSPVNGANGSSYTFPAHPVTSSNVNYYVEISNASTTNQSATALVTVIVDSKDPTITKINTPANNNRAQHFILDGEAKDFTGGNVVSIVYTWNNSNGFGSFTYTNPVTSSPNSPVDRLFHFDLIDPPIGTNQLTVVAYDLAGRHSKAKVVKGLFFEKPRVRTLNILGDGTGSLTVKTKGELPVGIPGGTLTNGVPVVLSNIYPFQTYSFTFTPDKKKDVPTVGVSVASVVSNAPTQLAGTSSTKKVVVAFTADDIDTSTDIYFNRDRFVDMAGQYNGVFTADVNAPTTANSRYFTMNVSKSRTVSGKLIDSAKQPANFTGTFAADGSVTLVAGTITIQGSLAWTGSENPNGVKQFVASATDGSWTAPLVADKVDTTALADGFATMAIPPTNGIPGGTGGIFVKAKNGGLNFSAILADDDKHPNVVTGKASRSGNVPLWILPKAGGLFFGTVNASNSLANLSATQLSWLRPAANPFNATAPAGFTNSPIAAICSPYDIANGSFSGTFTVQTTGSAVSNVNQVVTFATGKATPAGLVTAGSLANGVLKITFLDGGASKHKTTAVGYYLENATNGAGFYIQPGAAAAGSLSVAP